MKTKYVLKWVIVCMWSGDTERRVWGHGSNEKEEWDKEQTLKDISWGLWMNTDSNLILRMFKRAMLSGGFVSKDGIWKEEREKEQKWKDISWSYEWTPLIWRRLSSASLRERYRTVGLRARKQYRRNRETWQKREIKGHCLGYEWTATLFSKRFSWAWKVGRKKNRTKLEEKEETE